MPAPVFSDYTERLYGRIPDHYRNVDAVQAGDFPFKRFLSLLGDQAGALETLVDRIDFRALDEGGAPGATSDLVDPSTADNAWLDWLGQLVGVILDPALTELERRASVEDAPSGWRAGTKLAMGLAAKTALTGTQTVQVYDHSTDVSGIGAATEWDVLIVTLSSETPDPAVVLDAIRSKHAKPAGVFLYHRDYEATWATIEAERPTWADWEPDTWADIQETGI